MPVDDRAGASEHEPRPVRPVSPALATDVRRSAKVSELFLRLVPDQIENIATAVGVGNVADVKAHAHKLKGSCMSIGATAMAGIAATLEPRPANAPALVVRLRTEFAYVRTELLAEIGTGQTPNRPENRIRLVQG